jgi:signal-transduction protein with cAMP-binding, CBS, and nucleotidyltransferase domain
VNEHFFESAAKSAARATRTGLLRRDRVAEASTDPSRHPGDGVPGNSPGRQTVGQMMRQPTTTIEPSAHLAATAYLIKHSHDSALVVTTDTHEPVAMITDAEIIRAAAQGQDPENTRISHVVRGKPITVEADLAADAARLMLSKGVRHLLIVEKRRLVGRVDLADLCRECPDPRTTRGGAP